MKGHQDQAIRELPIVGEQLHVVGADATELHQVIAWNIVRVTSGGKPALELVKPDDVTKQPGQIFFIKPVVAAMKAVHAPCFQLTPPLN
jgi:hypothetical protein